MKKLIKEECMACLNQFFEDTNYYLGDVIYNDHNDEFDVLNQLIKKHFELIKQVETLLQEASKNQEKAKDVKYDEDWCSEDIYDAGNNDGWYAGEAYAYEKVLDILKQK